MFGTKHNTWKRFNSVRYWYKSLLTIYEATLHPKNLKTHFWWHKIDLYYLSHSFIKYFKHNIFLVIITCIYFRIHVLAHISLPKIPCSIKLGRPGYIRIEWIFHGHSQVQVPGILSLKFVESYIVSEMEKSLKKYHGY
jgi:hypothetical protein